MLNFFVTCKGLGKGFFNFQNQFDIKYDIELIGSKCVCGIEI